MLHKITIALTIVTRAITRDSEMYPNPSIFDPERFLPPLGVSPQTDPRKWIFGFGRRVSTSCVLKNPERSHTLRFKSDLPRFVPSSLKLQKLITTASGAHFAETSVFLNVASVLSVFTISKAKNKDGQETMPIADFAPGIVRCVVDSL